MRVMSEVWLCVVLLFDRRLMLPSAAVSEVNVHGIEPWLQPERWKLPPSNVSLAGRLVKRFKVSSTGL